jgi:hypothetical protein
MFSAFNEATVLMKEIKRVSQYREERIELMQEVGTVRQEQM